MRKMLLAITALLFVSSNVVLANEDRVNEIEKEIEVYEELIKELREELRELRVGEDFEEVVFESDKAVYVVKELIWREPDNLVIGYEVTSKVSDYTIMDDGEFRARQEDDVAISDLKSYMILFGSNDGGDFKPYIEREGHTLKQGATALSYANFILDHLDEPITLIVGDEELEIDVDYDELTRATF